MKPKAILTNANTGNSCDNYIINPKNIYGINGISASYAIQNLCHEKMYLRD